MSEPPAKRLKADNQEAKVRESSSQLAGQLLIRGVVVLTLFSVSDIDLHSAAFDKAIDEFPEYRDARKARLRGELVGGGFSALGNPASFHHPFVRFLREAAHKLLFEFFSSHPQEQYNYEMLPDRMLYRGAGKACSAESWHQDITSDKLDDDLMFGGWINLDPYGTSSQLFSCVPGSQWDNFDGHSFCKITKDKVAEHHYEEKKEQVPVHPGEIILFYQSIVHEVNPKARSIPQRRLFLGSRLTNSEISLRDYDSIVSQQAPFPLPSGQDARMWPVLHWTNHTDLLKKWSKRTFLKPLLVKRKMRSGKRKDETFKIVPEVLPSLEELGLPLYEPYSREQKQIFVPRRLASP